MRHYYSSLILLLLLNAFSINLQAQTINSNEALKVALNFLAEQNINPKNIQIELLKSDDADFFLFNFDKGFIIISDRLEAFPVIAWSTESNFNFTNIPPEVNFWIDQYSNQLKQISKTESWSSKKNKLLWNRYLSSNVKSAEAKELVAPLLNTYWNQGCYFNSALPIDSSGSCYHPYTGCVATVLAQIMKYYNYPKHGLGSLEIPSPYGPLLADFQNTFYQWTAMENNVTSENSAVAGLMYQCVVAVKSQFLPGGTGAYDLDAKEALLNYFDYSNDIQFLERDSYQGDWLQLMRDELNQERPIIYGAVDESNLAGHTFICDGYFDSSFFHINWGWGGQYNGYFYLDTLAPGNYNFNFMHDAIVGIRPNIDEPGTLYPPDNLSVQLNSKVVSITWNYPQGNSFLELLGYNVYRDDSLLNNSIITNLFFDEPQPSPGNHSYSVQSVFLGKGKGPSISAEIYINDIRYTEELPFRISVSHNSKQLTLFPDQVLCIEKVSLVNRSGSLVFESTDRVNSTGSISWDLPFLHSGIYLVQIKTDKKVFTQKLLIY